MACGINNDYDNSFDFEASIQISRILKILSDTIKNTEIALCLPQLLAEDGAILQHFFPPDQTNTILNTCLRQQQVPSINHTEVELSLQADMCLVMDLILSKSDLCKSLRQGISNEGMALLQNLEELRVCVFERLKITPKMQAQKDAELRRLYQQNIQYKLEVRNLKDKLDKLSTETEHNIEEKKEIIKKQIEKIAKVKQQCRDSIKRKMDEAERQINWDIKNSDYRLEELQAEAKATQYRREMQLKDHLNTEKDLRSKRYKVESQLVAMLQKYDSDIGERQAMLEELTANYEKEKTQLSQLKEEFDEQEREYNILMSEKEDYEKGQWEAKLYDIRCRIAARKIQRFFRAYLATKSKSKKGKKGKKKR